MASGSRPRFGTDGVRGRADTVLTDEYVLALGRAAARVLGRERWLIGRDTRESGPRIEAALADGLTREGADVSLLGVVPTPAVALASRDAGVPGAMISASHNPVRRQRDQAVRRGRTQARRRRPGADRGAPRRHLRPAGTLGTSRRCSLACRPLRRVADLDDGRSAPRRRVAGARRRQRSRTPSSVRGCSRHWARPCSR